jgi:hypothetical protein
MSESGQCIFWLLFQNAKKQTILIHVECLKQIVEISHLHNERYLIQINIRKA